MVIGLPLIGGAVLATAVGATAVLWRVHAAGVEKAELTLVARSAQALRAARDRETARARASEAARATAEHAAAEARGEGLELAKAAQKAREDAQRAIREVERCPDACYLVLSDSPS